MAFHKYALESEIVADYLPQVDLDNADQMAVLGRRNEAVSAGIDSYCKRIKGFFLPASATATPKQFRGENKNFLRLPVHVLGAIAVAGINAAQYYENEKNGWLYSQNLSAGNYDEFFDACANFFSSRRLYVVTARWGYEETPAEIIEATKIIAAHWFENGAGILGDITPNGYQIQRDMPPTAKTLLQPFIKAEFEID